MSGYEFAFCGSKFHALASGGLWWPVHRVLIVSDLHLGKTERLMRLGGPSLPPYEIRDTLLRLGQDIDKHNPAHVICLGDSFDDLAAMQALDHDDHMCLTRLQAGRHWSWITGNHDAGPVELGGDTRGSIRIDQITFRHIAEQGIDGGEISGHYHPKARITLRGHTLSRPCFLVDESRLIMPPYGTYTGGLFCDRPPLRDLMSDGAIAILTGKTAQPIPMPR